MPCQLPNVKFLLKNQDSMHVIFVRRTFLLFLAIIGTSFYSATAAPKNSSVVLISIFKLTFISRLYQFINFINLILYLCYLTYSNSDRFNCL